MAIFDIFISRKIKARRYFDETDKKLDLPGIGVQLSKLESTVEVGVQIGKIRSHKKITIPEGGNVDELTRLDMVQYNLAIAINTLNGKDKQEKTKEYVDVLLRLISDSGTITLSKKKITVNNEGQDFNFKELNKYLTDRGFTSTGLPDDLTAQNGYVIWPITLQPSVTYIHTAQIQLIKLLVAAGWKLHVIIGDCGKHSATVKKPINFKNAIENLLKKNDISVSLQTVTLLSRYFKRNPAVEDESLIKNATSLELLNTFHGISDSIVWCDYFEYITKNYNRPKKTEISKRKVLNNIQPLLNWTVVTTITNTDKQTKIIVVAGEDEKKQWDEVTKLHGNNKIGMIYIQELKDQNKTMDQSEINIGSVHDMLSKLDKGNMGQWLYSHFIELPKFLNNEKPTFCKISDNECTNHKNNCIKCLFSGMKNFNNANFDKNAFAVKVYKIANPANGIN